MQRFVVKMVAFVLCMLVVDAFCGIAFSFFRNHAKGGSTQEANYIAEQCNADILILGSSRANHHYNPVILDSIGGFAYNGGIDGQGIVLGLGRYLMCAENHVPKIVIYEITPEFDYLAYGQNSKYFGFLRPYYEKAGVESIFEKIETPFNRLKLHSQMYRNNSKLLSNVRDLFVKGQNTRGYYPQHGTLNKNLKENEGERSIVIDSVKLSMMESLINETAKRGTKLYFAISPRFLTVNDNKVLLMYQPGIELAQKYNVPVLNYIFTTGLSDNSEMFVDYVHMNDIGSAIYSRMIVSKISNLNGD
ncbi:hypothetical protein B7989_02635 [Fibrobacter sp. UWB5]|nr:hypothetical protein B7989_02635 [Fibrobacter sp. UWB5]